MYCALGLNEKSLNKLVEIQERFKLKNAVPKSKLHCTVFADETENSKDFLPLNNLKEPWYSNYNSKFQLTTWISDEDEKK